MNEAIDPEKIMVTLGPDNKPDVIMTITDGLIKISAKLDRIKNEILSQLPKDNFIEECEEDGKRFAEETPGEEEEEEAPRQPRSTGTQPAGRNEKEFWFKDESGRNNTVKLNMNDPVCPLCDLPMGEPRNDNYNKPSLYCKECRMYFNWSKFNDQPRRPAGRGPGQGRPRFTGRKQGGGRYGN